MENRIKEIRKDRGLTQEELAAALGISPQHLGKLERGVRRVSLHWLEQIARVLDCKTFDLLPGQSPHIAEPDVAPYTAKSDSGLEQRLLATLYPGHPNAMLYEIKSPVLDLIGFRIRDLVIIDFSQGAIDAIKNRDVVLVRSPENEHGDSEYALRLFLGHTLVTQTSEPHLHEAHFHWPALDRKPEFFDLVASDPAFRSLQADQQFSVRGVVKFLIRDMQGGAL